MDLINTRDRTTLLHFSNTFSIVIMKIVVVVVMVVFVVVVVMVVVVMGVW